MFRPAKIYHANLIIREDLADSLINNIHELGICELKEAEIDLDSKYSTEYSKEINDIQARLKFVTDVLEDYKPIPQPEKLIKALFSPRKPRRYKTKLTSTEMVVRNVRAHLNKIEPKVTHNMEKLKEIKESVNQNEFLISNLYMLPDIKTSVFESSENIKVFLGIITKASLKKIKAKLENNTVFGAKELEKEQVLLSMFSTHEDSTAVERCLHDEGFETLTVPYENRKPMEIIKALKKNNDILKEEERKIKKELRRIQVNYQKELDILTEKLEICMEKINALRNFKATNSFAVLEAWIPGKNLKKFDKILSETTTSYYLEINEKDDAPTILKNPKLIKPFEMITELYSVPKYKGFDPTPLLAVFFSLFFGFMLDDFFYGLLLLLLALAMVFGAGKYNETMKRFGSILIFFGITTMLWGVFFGAYFGNFFQELGIKLPIVVDAMRDVMTTLYIALGFGSLHLMVGLISGFYDNIYHKKIRAAFASQGVWIAFMVGIFLIIFKRNNLGLGFIGVAVLMQIVFTFIDSGFVPSLLSVFNFSGFVGDLFSYARLMALCIGTSGISLAVNFMVFLAVDMIPYIGIILGIIIFIIGHLFNMAMNGLGAFIHSTRLHFLEFFTKFYDGGGRKYVPFKAQRKNTTII